MVWEVAIAQVFLFSGCVVVLGGRLPCVRVALPFRHPQLWAKATASKAHWSCHLHEAYLSPDREYISGQCSTQPQAVSLPITLSTLLSVLPFLCPSVSDLGRTWLYSFPGWFHWRERPKEDIFSLCLLSYSYMINHFCLFCKRGHIVVCLSILLLRQSNF